ncbi:MAG: hypothetical protein V2A76_15340, partial [Planctomycetota bacterium]
AGDPVLSQVLSMITGELCVMLGHVEGEAALVLLAACEDPGRFQEVVQQSEKGSAPDGRIISGDESDTSWSAAQVGNWILLALGESSEKAAAAALDQLHEPPDPSFPGREDAPSPDPQGTNPFLRLEADLAAVGSLLAGRLEPSAGTRAVLTLRGWNDGGRLRVHLNLPAGSLLDCVPTVRIR